MEMHADSALVLVDIQCDYLPEGAMAIARGNEVVEPASRMVKGFSEHGLPVVLTRDWHPAHHLSFKEHGGKLPRHCVQDTHGAEFAADLEVPDGVWTISKGTEPEQKPVSAFDGTDLEARLKEKGVRALYVAGLATDNAVKRTVLDAREAGFDVYLIANACRGINVHASDSAGAVEEMMKAGVRIVSSGAVEDALAAFVAS